MRFSRNPEQRLSPETTVVHIPDAAAKATIKHIVRFPQDLARVTVPHLIAGDMLRVGMEIPLHNPDVRITDEQVAHAATVMKAAHTKYGVTKEIPLAAVRPIVEQFTLYGLEVLRTCSTHILVEQISKATKKETITILQELLDLYNKVVTSKTIHDQAKKYRENMISDTKDMDTRGTDRILYGIDSQKFFRMITQDAYCDAILEAFPGIQLKKEHIYSFLNIVL